MADINDFPVGKLAVLELVRSRQEIVSFADSPEHWRNPAEVYLKGMVIAHSANGEHVHLMMESGEKVIIRVNFNVAWGETHLKRNGWGGWRRLILMDHATVDYLVNLYHETMEGLKNDS